MPFKIKIYKKSQAFVIDFSIAITIFILLLTASIVVWNNHKSKLAQDINYNEMMIIAYRITDLLVKTSGQPDDWTKDNLQVIGLADSNRELSVDKVNNFSNINYDTAKEILYIKGYDFSFQLITQSQQLTNLYGKNSSNASQIISLRRFVLYNGTEAIMEFKIWD